MIINLLIQLGIPKQYAGDFLVLLLFVIVGIIVTALVKKRNLGALLISIYIAYAIVAKIFYKVAQNPSAKIVIFLALIFLLFSLLRYYVRIKISGTKIVAGTKTSLTSLAIVGLLASIVLQWFPQSFLDEFFTSSSSVIFLSAQAQLIWMIAPLIVVFLLKHRQ